MWHGAHLALEPPVKPASDHATRVGLDGDDCPQAVPEGPPHQKAAAPGLEVRDALPGHMVGDIQLP